MHHIAIMKKSWGLTEKILSGEKTIESRWYLSRRAPWGKISKGDTIFFKNTGEPVTLQAKVKAVEQYADLTPELVRSILKEKGKEGGIPGSEMPGYIEFFKDKKYCILVHLQDVVKVKPFHISKKGFGAMSAWITVKDVSMLKIPISS